MRFLSLILAIVLVAIGFSLSCSEDAESPTAPPTIASSPDAPESTPSPTASAEPEIRPSQLYEVATGRLTSLDAPLVWAAFSGDSKWFVHDTARLGTPSRIYRVDLASGGLTRALITEGIAPQASRDGSFVAFYRPLEGSPDVFELIVQDANGVESVMQPRGTLAGWSPDGRWLAFSKAYDPADPERVFFVFDSAKGETREVDRVTFQGGGDFRVLPEWSTTSEYFRHYAGRAASPFPDRHSVEVTPSARWAAAGNRRRALVTDGAYFGPVRLQIQDLDSGQISETAMGEGLTGDGQPNSLFAPDDTWVAVSNPPSPTIAPETRILNLDGTQVITVAGSFEAWSASGDFLMARGANACPGMAIYRTSDWQTVYCLRDQTGGPVSAQFSAQGSLLVYQQQKPQTVPFDRPNEHSVHVLDLVSGQDRTIGDFMGCIEWSPDGKWLVVGTICKGV